MTWKINTNAIREVWHAVRAGYPLIYVETWEEERLKPWFAPVIDWIPLIAYFFAIGGKDEEVQTL